VAAEKSDAAVTRPSENKVKARRARKTNSDAERLNCTVRDAQVELTWCDKIAQSQQVKSVSSEGVAAISVSIRDGPQVSLTWSSCVATQRKSQSWKALAL